MSNLEQVILPYNQAKYAPTALVYRIKQGQWYWGLNRLEIKNKTVISPKAQQARQDIEIYFGDYASGQDYYMVVMDKE